MKIIIMGGTGYVGQGIFSALTQTHHKNELISFSRSGASNRHDLVAQVNYVAVDLTSPGEWQQIIKTADVIVDCVGIFLPSKRKQTSYEKNSINPAKVMIDELWKQTSSAKFIFIAANNAPFFLNDYLLAKHTVIEYGQKKLDNQFVAVYPGMIYDRHRFMNWVPGILLQFAIKKCRMQFFKKYRPIKRPLFSQEMVKIIYGQASTLTDIIK